MSDNNRPRTIQFLITVISYIHQNEHFFFKTFKILRGFGKWIPCELVRCFSDLAHSLVWTTGEQLIRMDVFPRAALPGPLQGAIAMCSTSVAPAQQAASLLCASFWRQNASVDLRLKGSRNRLWNHLNACAGVSSTHNLAREELFWKPGGTMPVYRVREVQNKASNKSFLECCLLFRQSTLQKCAHNSSLLQFPRIEPFSSPANQPREKQECLHNILTLLSNEV